MYYSKDGMFTLNEIIFVDDDAIVRMLGKRILSNIKFDREITQFENGLTAIQEIQKRVAQNEIAKNEKPTLILLDINMPVMDGWDFLDEFSALPKSIQKQFYISIITSSIDRSDKEKAFSYPIVKDYIQKPMSVSLFMDFLKKHEFVKEE